jgi:hypothetical protein
MKAGSNFSDVYGLGVRVKSIRGCEGLGLDFNGYNAHIHRFVSRVRRLLVGEAHAHTYNHPDTEGEMVCRRHDLSLPLSSTSKFSTMRIRNRPTIFVSRII